MLWKNVLRIWYRWYVVKYSRSACTLFFDALIINIAMFWYFQEFVIQEFVIFRKFVTRQIPWKPSGSHGAPELKSCKIPFILITELLCHKNITIKSGLINDLLCHKHVTMMCDLINDLLCHKHVTSLEPVVGRYFFQVPYTP